MTTTSVSIIGGTGFIGLELTRLLLNHPKVNLRYITSRKQKGESISKNYPYFANVTPLRYSNPPLQEIVDDSDIVIFATHHTVSMTLIPEIMDSTARIIDMSGDFRLKDPATYEYYYKTKHVAKDLLPMAVYGLSELNYSEIKDAQLVANPGCFPTSALLAMLPLSKYNLLGDHTFIHSLTGSSGSGMAPSLATHHPYRANNLKPYSPGVHRHEAEINEILSLESNSSSSQKMLFLPNRAPFVRGIYTTILTTPTNESTVSGTEEIQNLFSSYYKNTQFIRICSELPQLIHVLHSNYCDLHITEIPPNPFRNNGEHQFVVYSVLDNLLKGGAGQAIQNLNIMQGYPENTGLKMISPVPS